MIGRERTVPRRQRRAAEIRQLLGMQLDRQAMRARRVEDARDLPGEKAIPSQKPSTASASPSAATAGMIPSQTRSI